MHRRAAESPSTLIADGLARFDEDQPIQYIPVFVIAVVAVWWLFMRPANLAARERREQCEREHERERQAEKSKLALTELETFHWQEKQMGGDMLVSVTCTSPRYG